MKSNIDYLDITGATTTSLATMPGEITAINSSTTSFVKGSSVSQELSDELSGSGMISTAISDGRLSDEARMNLYFPPAPGRDQFVLTKVTSHLYIDAKDSDIRATGALFTKLKWSGSNETLATEQKGLSWHIDYRQLPRDMDGKVVPDWKLRMALALKSRLIRAEILRGLTMLKAVANDTAAVWGDAANPDKDLRAAARRTRDKAGAPGGILIIGTEASDLRQDSYEDSGRTNHGLALRAGYSMRQVADYVGTDEAVIERGVYRTEGGLPASVLGNQCLTFCTSPEETLFDGTNVKRVWSPTPSGKMWTVAVEEAETMATVTVWHDTRLVVLNTKGIEMLTVTAL